MEFPWGVLKIGANKTICLDAVEILYAHIPSWVSLFWVLFAFLFPSICLSLNTTLFVMQKERSIFRS